MIANADVSLLDSRYSGATTCLVCGSPIGAGEGFTALFHNQVLRFKCAGCLSRFSADPDRFMSGHAADCCDHHDQSPASEWCD